MCKRPSVCLWLWLPLLSAFLLQGCRKWGDDFDFRHVGIRDYEAAWVANLVDVSLSIGDFVPDTVTGDLSLITDPDDHHFYIACQLDYHTDSLDVKKWLQMDSITGEQTEYMDNPAYPIESTTEVEAVLSFSFGKVDTVYLKEGQFDFYLSTPLDTNGLGAELQSNVLLEEVGGALQPFRCPVHSGKNVISLKDKYIIVGDSNIFRAKITYHSSPFTGEYADSSQAPLFIKYCLYIPDFHYITGEVYRDTTVELVNGKVEYSLLTDKMDFGLRLNHLYLHTDVATTVGIPLYCELDRLKYHNNQNNKTYDFLSSEKFSLKVHTPKVRGELTHTLDTMRINSETVFCNDGYVDLAAYVTLKRGRFFIDEHARYDVNAHLEFPLDLTIDRFRYADTILFKGVNGIDTNLGKAQWDWVQSLLLRYEFINGLPLDLNVQLFFMDSSYRVLDSLFTDRTLLKGAVVDPLTALVAEPSSTGASFITFDRKRVERIAPTCYLLLKADAATSNRQRVVLAADQKLRVRIGARVNAKVNYRN